MEKEIIINKINSLENQKQAVKRTVKKKKSSVNIKRKDEVEFIEEEIQKFKDVLKEVHKETYKINKPKEKTLNSIAKEEDMEEIIHISKQSIKKQRIDERTYDEKEIDDFLKNQEIENRKKRYHNGKYQPSLKKIERQKNLQKFLLSLNTIPITKKK